MIVQIVANRRILGAVECTENSTSGEIEIRNETANIGVDIERSTGANMLLDSNDQVLSISIDNEMRAIIFIKAKYTEFEVYRKEFHLSSSDDYEFVIEMVRGLYTYHLITEQRYERLKERVDEFFKYDGETFGDNDYDYEELDEFIGNLNNTLNDCLKL